MHMGGRESGTRAGPSVLLSHRLQCCLGGWLPSPLPHRLLAEPSRLGPVAWLGAVGHLALPPPPKGLLGKRQQAVTQHGRFGRGRAGGVRGSARNPVRRSTLKLPGSRAAPVPGAACRSQKRPQHARAVCFILHHWRACPSPRTNLEPSFLWHQTMLCPLTGCLMTGWFNSSVCERLSRWKPLVRKLGSVRRGA